MNLTHSLLGLAALALATSTATAQSYVDTFDGGVNSAGWTYGAGNDSIETTGGNPGAYLRDSLNFFSNPEVRSTNATNLFVGDLRNRRVSSIGIDLVTNATVFNSLREVTLMLTDGNCTIYYVHGGLTPAPGAGWKSFDFPIDVDSVFMPAGWATFCSDADLAWNTVIANVTEVKFFYGDPNFFYGGENWDIGCDNIRIVGSSGTAFCFGDGTGASCPCGNLGASGEGCANSTGAGALLDATGAPSVSGDTLAFSSSQLPPNKSALLFAGVTSIQGGVMLNDGIRCAGGQLQRLGVRTSDAGGNAAWGAGMINANGWSAGETRYFQVWYRDVANSPCASAANLSNGYEVQILN